MPRTAPLDRESPVVAERAATGLEPSVALELWQRIRAWRLERAEGEPDALRRRCKRFFNWLDLETTLDARALWHAVAGGDLERRGAVLRELPTVLLRGLRARAAGEALPYRVQDGERAVRGAAEELSAVFRAAQREAALELAELEDAFDLFARGALLLTRADDRADPLYRRYLLPACQPNSAFLFLFAELADLCHTLGVERAFWGALRPTLVYIQRVLHEECKPRFGLRALDWGTLLSKDPPARAVEVAELRRQRAQFTARFPLEEVWRFNVQRRVQPAPVADPRASLGAHADP